MIGRNELIALINTAYDAVNASKVGPIFGVEDEMGNRQLQSIGYNTFLYVVQKIVPTVMDANLTEVKVDGSTIDGKMEFNK